MPGFIYVPPEGKHLIVDMNGQISVKLLNNKNVDLIERVMDHRSDMAYRHFESQILAPRVKAAELVVDDDKIWMKRCTWLHDNQLRSCSHGFTPTNYAQIHDLEVMGIIERFDNIDQRLKSRIVGGEFPENAVVSFQVIRGLKEFRLYTYNRTKESAPDSYYNRLNDLSRLIIDSSDAIKLDRNYNDKNMRYLHKCYKVLEMYGDKDKDVFLKAHMYSPTITVTLPFGPITPRNVLLYKTIVNAFRINRRKDNRLDKNAFYKARNILM